MTSQVAVFAFTRQRMPGRRRREPAWLSFALVFFRYRLAAYTQLPTWRTDDVIFFPYRVSGNLYASQVAPFRFAMLHPYFRSRRRAVPFLPNLTGAGSRRVLLRRQGTDLLPRLLGQTLPRAERFWLYAALLPTGNFKRFTGVLRSHTHAQRNAADSAQLGLGFLYYEGLVEHFRVPFDIPVLRRGSRVLREPVSLSYLRSFRRMFRLLLRTGFSLGFGAFIERQPVGGSVDDYLPMVAIFDRWRRYGTENISHVGMGRR